MTSIDKLLSRDGVEEYWFLNEQLTFGSEVSSNPKDHCSLVILFRIPIKSHSTHVIDAAHVAKLEAALKVAVEASDKLLNKVNVVTAFYRHGQKITDEMLEELSIRQIETEKALAEIEKVAGEK